MKYAHDWTDTFPRSHSDWPYSAAKFSRTHSGGEKALRTKTLGRPKGKRLTDAQACGIRKRLIGK
jgi:hypothetical protein